MGVEAFRISDTTDLCTEGLWVYLKQLEDGSSLLVVDSEGMMDSHEYYKIFKLLLLLASEGGALIFNEMRYFGSRNLAALARLTQLLEYSDGLKDVSWPALVVLLKDFSLQLTLASSPVQPTQYLNHLLECAGDIPASFRKV